MHVDPTGHNQQPGRIHHIVPYCIDSRSDTRNLLTLDQHIELL